MNEFLKMLKKQNTGKKVNTESFTQMLIDEEYLIGEQLQSCYFCDCNHFDIMRGGKDVYSYIANRMQEHSYDNLEEHFEEVHHLGMLCNWMNFHGIPIFADSEKFPNLAILYCKDCGKVLGIKLDKWYYPYCGFFDDMEINYF